MIIATRKPQEPPPPPDNIVIEMDEYTASILLLVVGGITNGDGPNQSKARRATDELYRALLQIAPVVGGVKFSGEFEEATR